MPHLVVEYTENLKKELDVAELLKLLHGCLLKKPEVFPIGGIRSRAIELKEYRVADGIEDDAFIHITFKIGPGRTEAVKREISSELFESVKSYLEPVFKKRYLALSLELYEFTKGMNLKYNNIHTRFKEKI